MCNLQGLERGTTEKQKRGKIVLGQRLGNKSIIPAQSSTGQYSDEFIGKHFIQKDFKKFFLLGPVVLGNNI